MCQDVPLTPGSAEAIAEAACRSRSTTPDKSYGESINKGISLEDLHSLRAAVTGPVAGQKTAVMTVGCYDMFHRGHATLFHNLRQLGEHIVAGVHDNASIRVNKNKDPVDNLEVRSANAARYADKVFPIHNSDPTEYVAAEITQLREAGYHVVYSRGNDWTEFPGKEWLIANNVPMVIQPYTQGVSSSQLRKSWAARMELLPSSTAKSLMANHDRFIYWPLRKLLEAAAEYIPAFVSPNHVTMASVGTAVPCIALIMLQMPVLCALLVVMHDMLDRLDGAVAAVANRRGIKRDGEFGAFLDAMCDKLYGATMGLFLVYTIFSASSSSSWLQLLACCLFLIKLPLHLILSAVRVQDYCNRGSKKVAIKAEGSGKLATCAENFAICWVSFSLAPGMGWAAAVGACLQVISLDMGMRSLRSKLIARW